MGREAISFTTPSLTIKGAKDFGRTWARKETGLLGALTSTQIDCKVFIWLIVNLNERFSRGHRLSSPQCVYLVLSTLYEYSHID